MKLLYFINCSVAKSIFKVVHLRDRGLKLVGNEKQIWNSKYVISLGLLEVACRVYAATILLLIV